VSERDKPSTTAILKSTVERLSWINWTQIR
jgi:hypothetical protein